jgi:hypothetical protein
MSSATKSAVKHHLSSHDRFGKALYRHPGQPDSNGFLGDKSRQAGVERAAGRSSRQPARLEGETELNPSALPQSQSRQA